MKLIFMKNQLQKMRYSILNNAFYHAE